MLTQDGAGKADCTSGMIDVPSFCRTDMGSNLAPRSPEEGAADIYRVANLDPPTTGMYYDSKESVKL